MPARKHVASDKCDPAEGGGGAEEFAARIPVRVLAIVHGIFLPEDIG
jgi:hypothetical protein